MKRGAGAGGRAPGNTIQSLKFHPGGAQGGMCSEGSLFSSLPESSRHPPSSTVYDASEGRRDARCPPDLNPVQRMPVRFAHLHRPLDQVLHTAPVLPVPLPPAVVCVRLWPISGITLPASLELSIFEFRI
uniref:Uncharacterized protein n=1 Tax=Rousettus aegyptiacus TaxID=9407 RepID=A0A7J8C2M0_ROUAE|nr:hypothetical protein HJG63_009381 [Rousettus aegyptiacus]